MPEYLKRANPVRAEDLQEVRETVSTILDHVRREGDAAVRYYSKKFDHWDPPSFRIDPDQLSRAKSRISTSDIADIDFAQRQVRNFAQKQLETLHELSVEPLPGVVMGHKHIPIHSVGSYVPGGRYPLVASAHMSIITPKVAGVPRVIACTPPAPDGQIPPATLYAMSAAGADEIYILGGVQALAAISFGTESIKPVDFLVGPGNRYVAEAKRQLFGHLGIDLLAGPTEIGIIADSTADPVMVAADLLGQAEHDPNSRPWLVTTSRELGLAVIAEVEKQLQTLPTASVAGDCWTSHGEVVVARDDEEAVALSDERAPEHLEVQSSNLDWYFSHLRNYGSIFLGEPATVAYADKVAGPNHILPTGGAARYTGGLWVGKFLKTCSFLRMTPAGSNTIGPVASRACRIEGMLAHAISAERRVEKYSDSGGQF